MIYIAQKTLNYTVIIILILSYVTHIDILAFLFFTMFYNIALMKKEMFCYHSYFFKSLKLR